MGQRVGANQRQYHRIKNWLKEGVPQHIMQRRLNMTAQSLEHICAHLEGREEKQLQVEENPEYNRLKAENEALKVKLGEDEPEDDEDED